ncbi:MAG: tetratricopeptide repeat protein [Burkholderiaceae bacterium]|nr:tetratricopeptide repeat protein [Burkholderiaceae bacterium]
MTPRLVLLATLICTAAALPVASAQTPQWDAWFDADDFASIESEIERRLRADADDRIGLLARARLGVMWHDSARLDATIAAMERCLARNEADARCHWWLGRAFGRKALEAGTLGGLRYAGRAREHFERAAQLEPQAIDIRYDLHQYYILAPSLAGGGKAKARASLAEFAKLRPAAAPLLEAQLDLAEERNAEAEARLLNFAGSEDRGVRTVWQDQLAGLGFRYLAGKPPRLDDARRVFEFAADRFPDRELFQRGLGRVAQEQGRHTEAAAHFERALAIKAQPGAHYRLAQVAEKLGDIPRAIAHYEKTIRFPHGVPASILRDASERLRVLNRV